jgi:hypothetical protein
LKRKLLIVIASEIHVRNYISTNIFSELEKKYDCYYLASEEGIKSKRSIEGKNNFIGFFKSDLVVMEKHYKLFNVLMWRYRKRSSTFYFRFLRIFHFHLLRWHGSYFESFKKIVQFFLWNLLKNREGLYCLVLGNKVVFKLFFNTMFNRIPVNQELRGFINGLQPHLIIFPSSAYEPIGTDLIRISRENKTKIYFLIDNWDNLSSKSILFQKPDYIGVWGQQSKEHALQIHDFSEKQIYTIGTPRFENYYKVNKSKIKSYFDFKYILFVGCAIPFDETAALRILDAEITSAPDVYGNLKIVYRPHPWRQDRINEVIFSENNFNSVILDPQMQNSYNEGKDMVFQPDLKYYPSLLSNSEFVTGPLTTMLIEALIFYKKILAIAYDDGIHITSPHNAFKYYLHFKGLENIEGLVLCKKKQHMTSMFMGLYCSKQHINYKNLESDLSYYLINDSRPYKRILGDTVTSIMKINN